MTSLFAPLKCNRCGNELKGGKNSEVYLCLNCRVAFIMTSYPSSLPLIIIKENFSATGTLFYAPFYKMVGEFSIKTDDKKKMDAYSRLKTLGPLYYGAFYNLKGLYSDDLTIKYALAEDKIGESDEIKNYKLIDAFITPVHLEKIGRLIYLSYLDKAADITGVDVQYKLNSIFYALIPFERNDNHLKELILGTSLINCIPFQPDE